MIKNKAKLTALTAAFATVVCAISGVGLLYISRNPAEKTTLAANFTKEVATDASDSLTEALTTNVTNSILSTSIQDYLNDKALQNLITQRVTDYVSEDNSASMTEAVQQAVENTVADKIASFTIAQRKEIYDIVNNTVSSELGDIDITELSNESLEILTNNIVDKLTDSEKLLQIVSQMPITIDQLNVEEIVKQIPIAEIVATSNTADLSESQIGTVNEIIRDQVTELLDQVTNGANGSNGSSGADGSNGANGDSGTDGSSGTNGANGSSGTNGASGTNGTNGSNGSNGTNGSSGSNGSNGIDGVWGLDGMNGNNGANGSSGSNGTNGINGTNGSNGSSGSNGSNGTNGTNGNNGTNGTNGNNGTNGTNGSAGTNGSNGANGTNGTNGSNGSSGSDGYTPVKGVDYFTDDEVKVIISKASATAATSVNNQLTNLKTSITNVTNQITEVQQQVNKIESSGASSGSDSSATDISSLASSIAALNRSVSDIYSDLDVTKSSFSLFSAQNGSIFQAEKVDASTLSISDAIDILANNGKEYTQAINQMWYTIEQLKKNVGGKYEQLDAAIAGLTESAASTDGKLTDIFNSVAIFKEKLVEVRQEINNNVTDMSQTVFDYINNYKDALNSGDQSEIESAKNTLLDVVNNYYKYLKDHYDDLSTDQKACADNLFEYITNITNTLENKDLSIEEIKNLLTKYGKDVTSTTDILSKLLSGSIDDLRKDIENLQNKILDFETKGESTVIKDFQDACQNYQTIVNEYTEELNQTINKYKEILKTGTPEQIAAAKTDIINVIERYTEFLNGIDGDAETTEAINKILKYLTTVKETISNPNLSDSEIIKIITPIQNEINIAVNEAITAIQNQLKDYHTKLDILIGNNASTNEALKSLQTSVDSEVKDRISAIEDLKKELQSQSSALRDIQNKIGSGSGSGSGSEDLDPTIYVTFEQMKTFISEKETYFQQYSDDKYQDLQKQLDTILGLADGDTLSSITDMQETIVDMRDTLDAMSDDMQSSLDDLYALVATLSQLTDSEALTRAQSDEELRQLIGDSIDDYNKKLTDLEYSILDGDSGQISQTRKELTDLCDELQKQLTEKTEYLSTELQGKVTSLVSDLDSVKTTLSQDLQQTTNSLINSINSRDGEANTWCYDVTLKSSQSGATKYANRSSVVYPTYADSSNGYQWIITNAPGLNILENSDIQLFYNNDTVDDILEWGTSITYRVNNGTIVITVPSGYYKTVKGDIVIDTIHVTNPAAAIESPSTGGDDMS